MPRLQDISRATCAKCGLRNCVGTSRNLSAAGGMADARKHRRGAGKSERYYSHPNARADDDMPEQQLDEELRRLGRYTEIAAATEADSRPELNQAEIDSLLGSTQAPPRASPQRHENHQLRTDLRSAAADARDRVHHWSASCQPASATSPPTEKWRSASTTSSPCGSATISTRSPCPPGLAVFKAEESDNQGADGYHSGDVIYSIVDRSL